MDNATKQEYIGSIKEELLQFQEISKIIIFGSFFESKNPHDIDVAIVQESDNNFTGFFAQEIENGKIIYEK